MAIAPTCNRCTRELDQPGALVFGPPEANRTLKLHVCTDCWPDVWAFTTGRA